MNLKIFASVPTNSYCLTFNDSMSLYNLINSSLNPNFQNYFIYLPILFILEFA